MQLSVIDFFCGAGGFSEGFRQQGFEIAMGSITGTQRFELTISIIIE